MNPALPSLHAKLPAQSAEPGHWAGHMSDGIGATYGLEPMAILKVEPDHLLLAGNRGTYRLPRAAIVKLGRGGFYPWFFKGIRIHHNIASFPRELLFRSLGVRERDILAHLKAAGFPVA